MAAGVKLTGKRADFVNWSRREPGKAARKCWEMVSRHEKNLGWRHRMAQRGALAYSGCGLGDLFEHLTFDAPMSESGRRRKRRHSGYASRSEEQHARAIVETVVEKLFGMDQPKSQLVATDAPYEVRRQGVWADRFVEGTYHLDQGCYRDFWDMARQAALLAYCSTGTAAIRTEPDYVTKRVRNMLRSTLNTFIDPADIGAGKPLSYFDVTWENPEYLCEDERYKGKEDQIWKAADVPRHLQHGSHDGATFGTPMVKVLTAWRLPFGSFKGRHAVFIGGNAEHGPEEWLWWEDWKHSESPLAFLRCNRAIGDDFWGENMVEIMLDPLKDAELIDQLAKDTMGRTSQTNISIDGNTTGPASVLNAKNVNVFRYASAKGEKPPTIEKPGILNGDYFDWQARKIALAHELSHVSMMHQAGEVQGAAGHRSGRSIRLEASMMPEVFARKLRYWRDWVAVDCAKNHIRAASEIGKVDPDWQVTWPGADFEARVSVDVLNLDLNQYTVRAYAVSEQKGTPAERADYAQELYDRGEINDSQLTMILEGLYDTKSETKASTADRAYVLKQIDEILHGEDELVADEHAYMRDHYIAPLPWNDPQAMLAVAAPRFTQALIDRVPANRRALLRRFMEDIWALRQNQVREDKLAEASMNIAANTADPFAAGGMIGAPGPMDPMAATAGGAVAPPALGAPGAALPGAPQLNAPGPAGLV